MILLIASSRLLLACATTGFVHRIIACVGVAYAFPSHAGHRNRAPRVADSTSEGSSAKGIISLHWCVLGYLLVSCAAPVPCGWGGSLFRILAYAFVALVFRVLIVRLIWSSRDSLTSSSRHGLFLCDDGVGGSVMSFCISMYFVCTELCGVWLLLVVIASYSFLDRALLVFSQLEACHPGHGLHLHY